MNEDENADEEMKSKYFKICHDANVLLNLDNELDKKEYFQFAKESKFNHYLSIWYFNHRHIHIKDFLKNLKQCDKLKLFK